MRKLIALPALAVLLVSSAIAQTGPKFGRNGGIGAANSTMVSGEPSNGTFSINGATGQAAFSGVAATATTHPLTSDFFNLNDQVATTPNLLRATDTETLLNKIRFGAVVDNLVTANRANGPSNASVALGLRSVKPDYGTSTSTQEVDGLYIRTATGIHGDTSAILGSAVGMSGGDNFVNLMEGGAALLNPAGGAVVKSIRYQAAAFDNASGASFGQNVQAETGAIDFGTLYSSTSASNYFRYFTYANTNNTYKWSVDNTGSEYLAGTQLFGPIAPGAIASNWIETLRPYSTTISQTVSVSTIGQIALLGASKSSSNTCPGGCMGTIGLEAIGLNDNVTSGQRQFAYAGYFEATRAAGAGTTHGIEVDVRNRGSLVTVTPMAMSVGDPSLGGGGTTPGLWVASGAGETGSADNTVAIGVIANGARWRSGLMFDANGLVLRPDNKYEAIAVGPKQAMSFFDSSGGVLGNIFSTGTPTGSVLNLNLTGDSVAVETAGGAPQFAVGTTGSTYQRGPSQLLSVAFSTLPTCNTTSAGTIAFVNDAAAPIATWHQIVTAGGGTTLTFVQCAGISWQAF